jgi:hypothetical protein
MRKMEYKNRYGDKHFFIPDNEGNLLWEGDFGYCRFSMNEDKEITMVDPSGGPFIQVGSEWPGNKPVKRIESTDTGYKLIF